jgi:hypothetical protein
MDIVVTLTRMMKSKTVRWLEDTMRSRRVSCSSLVVFLIYSSKYCKQVGSYESFALANPTFGEIALPTKLAYFMLASYVRPYLSLDINVHSQIHNDNPFSQSQRKQRYHKKFSNFLFM